MNPDGVPAHLPRRLSICSWIWAWLSSALPGEPYGDLERAVRETVERGFNTVRIDAGLNWCFTLDGKPRGEVAFGPWIAGFSNNVRTVNGRGGARYDLLARVLRLFELAEKHGLFVILTSWEYQDSTWHIADPALRAETYGIPPAERMMGLARQHDRLLRLLKERGLAERVAFVEPHNEPEFSEFPQGEEGKRLHTEAIAWLRERHPDVLISADHACNDLDVVPANTQVLDMHLYAGASIYFDGIWKESIHHPDFDPRRPRELPLMRELLKPEVKPWEAFKGPSRNIREFWRKVVWLNENLDNAAWDRWMRAHVDAFRPRVERMVRERFAANGAEAKRRGIPLVLDEGGWFYPPLGSRFEETPDGWWLFELMADEAIANGYWGFMPTTYCGPEQPVWTVAPDWLRSINGRFLAS